MSLTNFNKIDISSRHQKFENLDKTNFRDIIRDLYDLLIRRPIYKILYKNFFKNHNYKIDYTIPAKGLSTLKRFKILNDFKKIEGLSVLNIGCGNGFTYHHLFKFKPKSIYGIDVLNYSNAWNDVNEYVHKHNIKTEVKFEMLDIIDLDPSLKFDLIISEAVFEHCKDFKTVARGLQVSYTFIFVPPSLHPDASSIDFYLKLQELPAGFAYRRRQEWLLFPASHAEGS